MATLALTHMGLLYSVIGLVCAGYKTVYTPSSRWAAAEARSVGSARSFLVMACDACQTASTNGLGNFISPADAADAIIAHVKAGGAMIKIVACPHIYIHTACTIHAKIDAQDGVFLWTVEAARHALEMKSSGAVKHSWLNHNDLNHHCMLFVGTGPWSFDVPVAYSDRGTGTVGIGKVGVLRIG
jgi:hypothetical protein